MRLLVETGRQHPTVRKTENVKLKKVTKKMTPAASGGSGICSLGSQLLSGVAIFSAGGGTELYYRAEQNSP